MKKLTLEAADGQKLEIQVPIHWGEVSLRTFLAVQDKSEREQFSLLCGITLDQYLAISSNAMEIIAGVLSFLHEEPINPGVVPYPTNLGAESIGQMELAKKAIMDTANRGSFAAVPYLYAIYMRPERINFQLALVEGIPQDLINEVLEQPATEVFGPAVFFWAKWLRSPDTTPHS